MVIQNTYSVITEVLMYAWGTVHVLSRGWLFAAP